MPALASFIAEENYQETLKTLPNETQEIMDLLYETEQADDVRVREKMLRCIHFIRKFSEALEPFTKQQIETACNNQTNV